MIKDNHKHRLFFARKFTRDRFPILSKIHVTGSSHLEVTRKDNPFQKKKEKKSNLLPIYVKFKSQAWNFNTDLTSLSFKNDKR